MITKTFSNARALVVRELNTTKVKSDYADSRGFGRDDTILGEYSTGVVLYDYWSGPYDGDGSSRTQLYRGNRAGCVTWCVENRPELLEKVCNVLGLECPEVTDDGGAR